MDEATSLLISAASVWVMGSNSRVHVGGRIDFEALRLCYMDVEEMTDKDDES